MTATMVEHAHTIFPEMMTHPVLFTHSHPKTMMILGDDDQHILREVLKHSNVLKIHHEQPNNDPLNDKRVHFYEKTSATWFTALNPHAIDIIINATDPNQGEIKGLFDLLNHDGILIQQSVSPFEMNPLKSLITLLRQTGFSDLQLLNFPQPNYATGWRSIVMALKNGIFKRLREKVIYNKPFKTHYYNFDVHKAAAVLPEFMRHDKLF